MRALALDLVAFFSQVVAAFRNCSTSLSLLVAILPDAVRFSVGAFFAVMLENSEGGINRGVELSRRTKYEHCCSDKQVHSALDE